MLLSPITAEVWSKVQEYTSRTRHLSVENLEDIHPTVFTHLARLHTPIFPKLTRLVLEPSIAGSSNAILFLAPTITSFSVYHWNDPIDPQNTAAALFTLAWKTPALQDLTIGYIPRNAFVSFKTFQQLRTLKIDECTEMDYDFLRELSSVKELDKLSISFSPTSAQLILPHPIPQGFRRLRDLGVTGEPTLLRQLFSMISKEDGALKTVAINYPPIMQVSNITGVAPGFIKLHKDISHFKSITSLTIDLPTFDDEVPESARGITNSIAMPLFGMVNLRLMNYRGTMSLSDDDAEKIALSLPNLKSFWLWELCGPLPTSSALSSFAQHCPDVHMLGIPINFDADSKPDALQVSGHRLRTLALSTPFQNANQVARRIDRLFPFLEQIIGSFTSAEQFKAADAVQSIIRDVCQPVREDQLQRVRDART